MTHKAPQIRTAKLQSTYVWQTKPAFGAAYSGANSLRPEHEKSYSFTATAAIPIKHKASGRSRTASR